MRTLTKTIIGLLALLFLTGTYYIFSPNDNLPASSKLEKTTFLGKMIVGEFLGGSDEFKEAEENPLYNGIYRLVHINSWVDAGMKEAEIQTALQNMKNSTLERWNPEYYDTVKEYGPGNWVWEFEQVGDNFSKIAENADISADEKMAKNNYLLASMYYKTAAFPGIFEEWGPNFKEVRAVYRKSLEHYEKAGRYFEVPLEVVFVEVDGKKIKGYLHLPENSETQNVPAVLSTNGSDFFMVDLYPSNQQLLEKNIAVLTFDIPGIGASHTIALEPNVKLHEKFLEVLEHHPKVDATKLGAVGRSIGGHLTTRFALTHPDKIQAAVNVCGPVDQVTQIPTEVARENFPEMTLDALWSRFQTGQKDNTEFSNIWSTFGLVSNGIIKEGQKIPIPILSLNTQSDPANPVWEMNLLAKVSEGGKVIFDSGAGHCPHNENPAEIADWLVEQFQ